MRFLTATVLIFTLVVAGIGTQHQVEANQADDEVTLDFTVVSSQWDPSAFDDTCSVVDTLGNEATVRVLSPSTKTEVFATSLTSGELDQGESHCSQHVVAEVPASDSFRVIVNSSSSDPALYDATHSSRLLESGNAKIRVGRSDSSATQSGTSDEVDEYPVIPEVVKALRVTGVPGSSENYLDEPLMFVFDAYGFDSEDAAINRFDWISDWYLQAWSESLELPLEEFSEVSIGRIGDQRSAFIRDDSESPPFLITIVRVGQNIQVTLSLSFGGDITEYVGGFLEEFLADSSGDVSSLIPELSDLPRGWQISPSDGPLDITAIVQG
jgi:hypothetical protein